MRRWVIFFNFVAVRDSMRGRNRRVRRTSGAAGRRERPLPSPVCSAARGDRRAAGAAQRPDPKKSRPHHRDGSGAGLSRALEFRRRPARHRRGFRDRRQSHHDERARRQQQPLPHRRARRRSEQISRHGFVRGARLRSGAPQSRVAGFFQEHGAADLRRNSGTGIDRLGLRLSAWRRTHVGHDRHRFANRFPALHPFVDRLASRHPDQRAD